MHTVSPTLYRRDSLSANVLYLFAAEGALFQFISTINSFANNLFATALGADYRALLIFYLCLFILRLPVLYLLMRRCPK